MCYHTASVQSTHAVLKIHEKDQWEERKQHREAASLHKDEMSMLCLHVELVSVNSAGGQ